jgi:hypothetical protein
MINETAPAVKAPKQDFIHLESFPLGSDGPNIVTIVGYNFLKDHTFEKDDGSTYQADAIEWYLGATVEGKLHFVKTWPKTYSISNKAFYFKLYKAALGKDPVAGSTPKDVLGAGVTVTLETKEKTSGKGKKYTTTSVKGDPSPVHPKLKNEIAPLATLRPALEKALTAKKDDKAEASTDVPF